MLYDGVYPTLPILERYGFDFEGWVDSNGNQVNSGDTYNPNNPSNHTLYAKWKIKQFTIEVVHDGNINHITIDDETRSSKTVDYYTKVKLGATPGGIAPEGFENAFQDWRLFTEGGYIYKSDSNPYFVTVSEDCKYLATTKVVVKTYIITVKSGIGTSTVRIGHPDYSHAKPYIPIWDATSSGSGKHTTYSYIYNSEVIVDVFKFISTNSNLTDPIPWTGENNNYRFT